MKAGTRKVDEQAREVISSILLFEVSDPRLQLVTITGCSVSFDRAYCDVFYTAEPERYASVEAAFQAAKGHIRSLMAKQLAWKQAPELRFHLDETVDAAEKLGKYLSEEKARQAAFDEAAEQGGEL